MNARNLARLVAAALVVGLFVWLGRRATPTRSAVRAGAADPAGAGGASRGADASRPPVDSPPADPQAPRPVTSATVRDRRLHDEVERRLRQLAAAAPPVAPSSSGQPLAPDGEALRLPGIEPSYVQERVREDFFPLASQCYQNALALNPKLAGKLILDFAIDGDEKVGGIVEDASIDPASDIQDDEMRRCLRESMMTMAFRPPTQGGRVTVKYPIDFSPDETPPGAASAGH